MLAVSAVGVNLLPAAVIGAEFGGLCALLTWVIGSSFSSSWRVTDAPTAPELVAPLANPARASRALRGASASRP